MKILTWMAHKMRDGKERKERNVTFNTIHNGSKGNEKSTATRPPQPRDHRQKCAPAL